MRISPFFAFCLLTTPLTAQPPAGSIGIYFDAAATQRERFVPAYQQFQFYVIGFELGQLSGWEARVSFSQAGWSTLGITCNPILACDLVEDTSGNFIVGLGGCFDASPSYVLVSYNLAWFAGPQAPNDLSICLGPSTPSDFGDMPGYATCGGELIAFSYAQPTVEGLPAGCAIVNPSTVATSTLNLGSIKARW